MRPAGVVQYLIVGITVQADTPSRRGKGQPARVKDSHGDGDPADPRPPAVSRFIAHG